MKQPEYYQHPCEHCGKRWEHHLANTLNCPEGSKTRIGYIHFNKNNSYTPKKNWKPTAKMVKEHESAFRL